MAAEMRLVPEGKEVTLDELLPGTMFVFDDCIAVKSEYRCANGLIEAFIIDSGEQFWGWYKDSERTECAKGSAFDNRRSGYCGSGAWAVDSCRTSYTLCVFCLRRCWRCNRNELLPQLRCKDGRRKEKRMTFTYRVFYMDDSLWNYGKVRSRLVRARTKEKAVEKFREKYGIEPMYAK